MPWVPDASVTLAWCFEEAFSAPAEALWERLRDDAALVPPIWHLEVTNALLTAERKGRITPEDVAGFWGDLPALDIRTVAGPDGLEAARLLELARTHRLSVYDACYLGLALALGVPLATFDGKLRDAALAAGVSVA